eukprot:jgi/Undpi1/13365/HiC_scaffold_8.g03024.m1
MSRVLNPIGAASAAMRTTARRRVVQKVLEKSSTKICEREFMVFMKALPENLADDQNPAKMAAFRTAQKELDACLLQAANHSGQNYVSTRMKQLSEVAATKKRRGRNGIGRGRWNPTRVF